MSKRANASLARMLYSAMFLALAMLLPFLTSQIPEIGSKLCPMHLPVILCGFVCGSGWGAVVGATAPLLRSLTFGRPILIPDAVSMAFELAVYAFVAGMLYRRLPKNYPCFFVSLITAMVCGRLIWGAAEFVLIFLGHSDATFGFSLIWTHTVIQSIPGIVLQLVTIPLIIDVLRKNRLMLN